MLCKREYKDYTSADLFGHVICILINDRQLLIAVAAMATSDSSWENPSKTNERYQITKD